MFLRCQSEPPFGERRGTGGRHEWTYEATEGNGAKPQVFPYGKPPLKGKGYVSILIKYNFGWHRESYRPIWGEIWLFLFDFFTRWKI